MEKIELNEKKMPLLDCLIPICEPPPFLEASLESLISQSFKDFRILIYICIEDPASFKIIEKIQKKDSRLHLFTSNKKVSIPKALNFLVKKAKAKYIAFQFPSDLSHSKRFELQMDRIKNSSLVGLGTSIYWDQSELSGPTQEIIMPESPKEVLYAQIGSEEMRGLFLFSSIYTKEALKNVIPFSTDLSFQYDIEFNARVQMRYPFRIANLTEILYTIKLYEGCPRDVFRKEYKSEHKNVLYPMLAPALFEVKHYYYDNTLISAGYLPY